jgi:predicted site-specific integrase-resolvase
MLKKYLKDNGIEVDEKTRKRYCYCRVSSSGQKDDLARQVNYMKRKYPNYEIIKDIGSGLNFNRRGLKRIIDEGINPLLLKFNPEPISFIIS